MSPDIKIRRCDRCNSIEGEPRPIGRYVVVLKNIEEEGVTKLVCQGCYHKEKIIGKTSSEKQKTMTLLQRLKKMGVRFIGMM